MNEFKIIKENKLCIIFSSVNKRRPGKPNRSLVVAFRKLDELFKQLNMEVNYIYNVGLYPGATAGNHFHKNKKEIFFCPIGQEVEIVLMNPESGEKEIIRSKNTIEDEEAILVYVKLGTAHAVTNKSKVVSGIMVFSNIEELDENDDFPHQIS